MEKDIKLCEEKMSLFPFYINKDIDALLPEDKRISFPKSFAYLRKKLQIKQSRKTHIDSILKKCKARFFREINDCIKQCVKIQIKKFPQSFITNISIEYNKYILNLSVCDLYRILHLFIDNIDFQDKNCFLKGKEKYFEYIYYSKISDLYLSYIQSKRYKREIENIKINLGLKMYLLYEFVSENFVNYYTFSQPHFYKNVALKPTDKKIDDENTKISISLMNSTSITNEAQ